MNSVTAAPTRNAARIRLLFITDEMEVGGTQRQIVHIVKGLDRRVFDPTVAYFCNRSFLVDELVSAGIRVIEIPKRMQFDPLFVTKLVRFMRTGKFDLVHCFSFTGELWGAVARRFLPGALRPVLVTSIRSTYDWYSPLQWRLKRWTSTEASTVIANSRAGAEHARARMGLRPGAIEIIYNGVRDTSAVARATPPVSPGGDVTALFVGRLVEHKNVPVLLRAMKRLRDASVSIRLRIVGDGPLRSAHAEHIVSAGLCDVVELLGERTDTPMLMAAADFIVMPSLREGLSNVILEAMAAGRAVIASAVGGNVELVESMQTGLLFKSDDDVALATAMRRLAEDRPLRESLGARGRQLALDRFTVSAMVRATQAAYLRCLEPNLAMVAKRRT
ncbi:MAG: glycosyltransferase [Ramlibacter sp.]|nr:glycosyltransferase [Ramlibacter sp.]